MHLKKVLRGPLPLRRGLRRAALGDGMTFSTTWKDSVPLERNPWTYRRRRRKCWTSLSWEDGDSTEEDWLVWPTSLTEWDKRAETVRQAMMQSWKVYESVAFGRDELLPVTSKGDDSLGGLGLSLVEALPTLHLMGLTAEFQRARDWVEKEMVVEGRVRVNRGLAGAGAVAALLSAYDFTEDEVLLARARQLADHLLHLPSGPGLPPDEVMLSSGQSPLGGRCSLRALGGLPLEMEALSFRVGRPSFGNYPKTLLDRLHNLFPEEELLPDEFDCSGVEKADPEDRITAGAGVMDFYDALLKTWILLGKPSSGLAAEWKGRWVKVVRLLINRLQRRSSRDDLYLGEIRKGNFSAEMEVDACRLPASIAAGILAGAVNATDINVFQTTAYNVTVTCYRMYSRMLSGISPMAVGIHPKHGLVALRGKAQHQLQHQVAEALYYLWRLTKDPRFREYAWRLYSNVDKHAQVTTGGYSGLQDVTKVPPRLNNRQHSIWMGGTLRYLYLTFSPPKTVDLHGWLFNNRGHLLKIGATKHADLSKDVMGVERA
eukprot:jgi/Botrbrau1/19819/Bobra.0124s0060.1